MYLYSYLPTHGISGLAARSDCQQFEVRLKMTMEWTQRYTPRPWSSKFGDATGDRNLMNSEMDWEAAIERGRRCNWRPRLSELRDALRAVIERVSRCTCRRLWSREMRGVLNLETVDGRRARCWDSIHRSVNSKPWECDKVTLPLMLLLRSGCWQSIWREVSRMLKLHSRVNLKWREWTDDRKS